MEARLIVGLAGDPMREIGEIVSGDEAVRMVEAGFAVPIVAAPVTIERADLPKTKRETRKAS